MSGPKRGSSDPPDEWEQYWAGAAGVSTFIQQGESHGVLTGFWAQFFAEVGRRYEEPSIVDIASGGGAVLECARQAFGGQLPRFTCLDRSASAVQTLAQRFPGVQGLVADASAIPLPKESFDVATSQFGVEYAGSEAIGAMARLVRPEGTLGLVMHHAGSMIRAECHASGQALRQLRTTGFLPCAREMLQTGFAACRGADQAPFQQAAQALMATFPAVEGILDRYGKGVAGDTVLRLYNDVARIGDRISHYDPAEVLPWLDRMEQELEAFAGRVDAMYKAALDEEAFGALCDSLSDSGFSLDLASSLALPGSELPLAWALVGRRN